LREFLRRHQRWLVTLGWLLTVLIFTLKDSALESLRRSTEELESLQSEMTLESGEMILGHEIVKSFDGVSNELAQSVILLSGKDPSSAATPPGIASQEVALKVAMNDDLLHWQIDATADYLQSQHSTSGVLEELKHLVGDLDTLDAKINRKRTVQEGADVNGRLFEFIRYSNDAMELQQRANSLFEATVTEGREKVHQKEKTFRHLTWAFYICYFVSAALTLVVRLFGDEAAAPEVEG
jgi:hypothetical protein